MILKYSELQKKELNLLKIHNEMTELLHITTTNYAQQWLSLLN